MSLRLTAWRWHFIFVSTQDSFTAVRHLQLSAFSQSSSELPCVYFGRLGKPWNSVVRLFSSVFLRDLWYDSPHNIGCVADMHRSSLLSPSFLIISSYLFDFPLFFFNAASTNFTYLFPPTCSLPVPTRISTSHLSLSTPAGLVKGGFSSNCTLYIWSRFDILCHYFMIHWSAEWKNWIVFFAARAQQRAKLALIFSEASFESSVEHFHFDTFLVSSLDYTSRAHSLILNDKKI